MSMLIVVLITAMIMFAQLYSVIGDMEDRIQQYITMDQLSGQLRNGKIAFISAFSKMQNGELDGMGKSASDSAFYRYRALITVRTLKSNYDDNHQKYFLNRAIINGLEYLNDNSNIFKTKKGVITPETYTLYYRDLKVYDYLLNFTNYMYLSAAVTSDVNASIENMHKIRILRLISAVLLLIIVLCSTIAAIIITKHLAMHVKEMLQTAENITRGNFGSADLKLTGPREFINLKDKINIMKHSLHDRIELENKLHAQALEHEKITKELERARYLSLQAQINPHFLFNTLNIISHTALFEHADKCVKLINSLSAVFRYRLEFKNEVTLDAELTFVQQYLEIQKARFGDRLTGTISCDKSLHSFVIPPFVIQPFVENAVIHGIEPMEAGGIVIVSAEKDSDNTILIRIDDNGKGVPDNFSLSFLQSDTENQHIGITNVIKRLTMYFGSAMTVCIKRKTPDCGTIVTIQLPEKGGNIHEQNTAADC